MLFNRESMGRSDGSSILALTKLCLFVALLTQNVCAYPYGNEENERHAARIGDISSIESKEPANYGTRFQRGVTNYKKERMHSDGTIVFPGELNARQVTSCKGSTYCETVGDTYPEDEINRALQRNQSLKYLAGEDVVVNDNIAQRIDVTDDVPLCVSVEQIIYPKSAENKDSEWKTIVNQDNFKQGVRIEKCSMENKSCSVIGGISEGYKTSCKQKYVYRQLASLSTDGNLVQDAFRMPSSCCCHVSFNGNPLARIGINAVDQRGQVSPFKPRSSQ